MPCILITGAAGFIGSHLTDRCLKDQAQVVGVDCFDSYYDPRIKQRNLAAAAEHPNFRLERADIRDREAMRRLLGETKFDVVVHLAARAGVRPSLEDPGLYFDVNVQGTLSLLDAMRQQAGTPLIFASSSSVYGGITSIPFREQDENSKPVSPYAASKKAGEVLCHTYHHLYGIPVAALRFFTVYGPRQRPDMAIAKFARLLLAGEPIPMFGDGETARDYTYVDDIVDGVVRAMQNVEGYEIYNLGESRTTRLSELIQSLAEALNKEARIERKPMQAGDVQITCADVSKAKRRLGYRPSTEVRDGLRRYADWLLQREVNS